MAIEGELPMSAMGMLLCTMIALLAFGVGLVYLALTVGLPGDKPRAEPVDQGGAGRGGMARMRAGAARRRANAGAQEDGAEDDTEVEPAEAPLDTKAARKAAKKQDKNDRREAAEDVKDVKEGRAAKYEEKRRAKDEEREAVERQAEEELARIAASHAKDEQAEFDKWKDLFSVDDGGTVEEQISAESQGLLAEFVEYIQQRKTVVLEELAAHFGLRTQDVINRIAGLENMGRLTGVMDDRGKYIYVSTDEMEAVAKFIQATGRISIAALAAKSNEFVDLSGPQVAELTVEQLAEMDTEADDGEAVI